MLISVYASCCFILWLSSLLFFRKSKPRIVGLESVIVNAKKRSCDELQSWTISVLLRNLCCSKSLGRQEYSWGSLGYLPGGAGAKGVKRQLGKFV